MINIVSLPISDWTQRCTAAEQELAIDALERGGVLLLPQLGFPLLEGEDRLLSPTIAGKSKNVSLDPASGTLRASGVDEADRARLQGFMMRFVLATLTLLGNMLPRYASGLQQGRASFRPVEVAGRPTSWRKDDTRLHVDGFPSSPTQGKRILRVFANINPHGQTRRWRIGDSFEGVARRFLSSLPGPIWGASRLLEWTGITKGRRTAYDHFMLQLHDRMKADSAYQSEAPQGVYEFRAGSTWIVFTDQVSHAAMQGQYALEQTFYLPVDCMRDPTLAPVRVLERLLHRDLAR
jgi:hypothetical protein